MSNEKDDPIECAGQGNDNHPATDSLVTSGSSRPRMSVKIAILGILVVLIIITVIAKKSPSNSNTSGQLANPPRSATQEFSPDTVLATVNGTPITITEFTAAIQKLPSEHQALFAAEQHRFLNELIVRELMLQEAKEQKLMDTAAYAEAMAIHDAHPGHEEHTLINVLLEKEVFEPIVISEEEIRDFYDQNKARFPKEQNYTEVREFLHQHLQQAKGMGALEDFITRLKSDAKIDLNLEWIEAQQQAAADNPLDLVLGSGKPVLADFGRGTCKPCQTMKPILEQLAEDLKDSVHILILDLGEYEHLGRRYQTRIIPAQLFFDGDGKQLHRHEGFMSREDMILTMKELGMLPE